ncbi:hypothetical protein C4K39_2168 [Pseudomonas sessilinigenes]|nr:hypothetical protein C4K39_2168 [Pseudomonas sessilinigenes]
MHPDVIDAADDWLAITATLDDCLSFNCYSTGDCELKR